jgi:MFS family permease
MRVAEPPLQQRSLTVDTSRTDWPRVVLLIGVGVGCAIQIGKVPPAIDALRATLGMSIVQVAWVLSLLSVLAAICGCLAGTLAASLGALRVTVGSVLLVAAASAVGTLADSPALLLASRVVEGIGLLLAVVSVPTLLAANTGQADRQVVSGLWGSYMGVGMAAAMLVAPFVLRAWGWRALWLVSSALMFALAVLLVAARPRAPPAARQTISWSSIRAAALQREPLLYGLIFACHAFQYFAVFGFLPTMLTEQGVDPRHASLWTALAVAVNALGNVLGGWLMKRGAPASVLFIGASFVIAVAEIAIYATALDVSLRIACAVVFALAAGLVPAAIFVRLRMRNAEPGAATIVMGLVVQSSHIGQLLAPVTVAAIAHAAGGWQLSPLAVLPAAACVVAAALALRPFERPGVR